VLSCFSLTGCFAGPPQIVGLDPGRDAAGVQADAPISVQFDRAVTPASIAGRFTVAPAIRGCNVAAAFALGASGTCRVVWLAGNTEFVLQHPGAILEPARGYTFTLRGGFSDPDGAVNTVDHSWGIATAPAPQVRSATPGDGARDVPIDSPLAVSFSVPMAESTSIAAISLSPAVRDTRVVANSRDPSRFVVLPGQLLATNSTYRLSVSTTATDQHGQPLATPWTATFSTGELSANPHALVLARTRGEAASSVMITALAPAQAGEPAPAASLLQAPRCSTSNGCGTAAFGAPVYSYTSVALAPGGRWLAVGEHDETGFSTTGALVVVDPSTGATVATLPGGSLPSWSPDGSTLAYAQGPAVRLFNPDTGASTALPGGDPILAPPVWSPSGELLALDVGGRSSVEHIEFADAVVNARYPMPGLSGPTSTPVISPDGTVVAVYRSGGASPGTWLVGTGAEATAPRLLDPDLVPIGFSGSRTLIALSRPANGVPGLVRVSVADGVEISLPHAPSAGALTTVRVSAGGRQLVFLAPDAADVTQAYVENADGSDPQALTSFDLGAEAAAVTVTG
jgi:Bacterial Ig-like domain/WD40-like Beta Propeller Repeat